MNNIKLLTRFLKENNAYISFIYHLQNNKNLNKFFENKEERILYMMENSPLKKIILSAFYWDGTNEGYKFWYNINKKWMKIYADYNNIS